MSIKLIANTIKEMKKVYSEKKTGIIYRTAEVGLLFVIGLYILTIDISKTTLKLGISTGRIEDIVIIALSILTIVRMGYLLAEFKDDRRKWLRFIACALSADAVYFFVWHENPSKTLLVLMLLTMSTISLDYIKILKVYIVSASAVIFTAIAMEWIGAIENYVYIRDMTIRSSWGIKYPTDLMSLLFFLLLAVWVVYGGKGGLWYVIPGGVLIIMSRNVTDSRTGVICGALFIVTVIGWHILKQKEDSKYELLVERVLCCTFPFFTIVMNGLVLAYRHGSGWAYKINEVLSNRLYLSVQALNEYGLSMWGKPLEQVGWGGSVFAKPDYNFVDISYVLLLLKFGIVALLLINILWVMMTRHAFKTGDKRLGLALTLIAVNCAIEHHILQLNYDIFVAIPFAVLASEGVEAADRLKEKTVSANGLVNSAKKLTVGALLAAAVSFCVLELLPKARTLITLINTDNSANGRRLLAVAVAAGLFLAARGIGSLYKLILGFINKELCGKKDIVMVAALALMVCLAVAVSNLVISRGAVKKDELVESERSVIELVQSNKSGKLYVKGMPEIYRKKYGDISSSLFNGEELGRYRNTSVVMDLNLDSPCFFNTGFLYLPISEKHALFTNDEPVIKALQKEGYHLTGYFPAMRTVNLKTLAKKNDLTANPDGTITLHGDEEALREGPGKDLRTGRYTVTYELATDLSADSSATDEVCRLITRYYKGEYELSCISVTRDKFDSNGEYTANIVVEMPDAEGTDFCIYPASQSVVTVKSISYQKTPKCDMHSIFNKDKVKIREEYYDLEGNPYEGFAGYFAKDIGYDGTGNIDHEIYYDRDNNRTLNSNGYCEIKKTFDGLRHALREEYYGIDGRRCELPPGQSAVDLNYDEKGNQIKVTYYDVNDKPVLVGGETWGGYWGLSREFNEEGKITNEAFFGISGEPVTLREGYTVRTYEYDANGYRIREAYFDAFDKPANCTAGYSSVKRVYDEFGRVICEKFYGTDGKRTTLTPGHSAAEYRYDEAGNRAEVLYLDMNDNPVMIRTDEYDGYQRVKRSFDEYGRIIRAEFFDINGNRVGEIHYDESGNVI